MKSANKEKLLSYFQNNYQYNIEIMLRRQNGMRVKY